MFSLFYYLIASAIYGRTKHPARTDNNKYLFDNFAK